MDESIEPQTNEQQLNALAKKVYETKRWALAKGVSLRKQIADADMDGPTTRAFDALVAACEGVLPEEVSEAAITDQTTQAAG